MGVLSTDYNIWSTESGGYTYQLVVSHEVMGMVDKLDELEPVVLAPLLVRLH